MFSPLAIIPLSDIFSDWGKFYRSPLEPWISSLLQPMGSQNHAPQLCWVRSDLLACVWMAGDQEGTSGMSIMMSLFFGTCDSWSPPQLVSHDVERSEQNPLLFVDNDQLYLIHTAQSTRSPMDFDPFASSSFSMQWTADLRCQRLKVNCIQAHKPQTWDRVAWSISSNLIDRPSFCRNPPVKRCDGSWLLPTYRSFEEGGAFGHDCSQVLFLSPNKSNFISSHQHVNIPSSKGRVHGSIVLSSDKSEFLQFFRSRLADRIYVSRSDLDGLRWTIPKPTPLPNNNSSIQAKRLMSGRLAMIYNRFCFEPDSFNPKEWGEANWPRTRWPLSVALSEDDGVSWPWIRDIDTGFGFCGTANWTLNGQLAYPSLVEGQPGELHIAYSWAGRTAIRYVCLQECDILGLSPE